MSDLPPQEPAEEASQPDPHGVVIAGHNYDGIEEFDNPMPGWWTGIFWATVVFAVVYVLGIRVFGFVDTYEEDLAQGVAELETIRAAYEAANPSFEVDAPTLKTFVESAEMAANGAATYATFCASCHGAVGEGQIGPNLTDDHWIHGHTPLDMWTVIEVGVAAQGMPGWSAALNPEERAEVVAFVWSLHGTAPANAKEPQGDLLVRTDSTAAGVRM
ncbi:MAG: cbb3-type cytochrome c oxidase N-terminal domain-containing protein [Bacteroidota bacterium]